MSGLEHAQKSLHHSGVEFLGFSWELVKNEGDFPGENRQVGFPVPQWGWGFPWQAFPCYQPADLLGEIPPPNQTVWATFSSIKSAGPDVRTLPKSDIIMLGTWGGTTLVLGQKLPWFKDRFTIFCPQNCVLPQYPKCDDITFRRHHHTGTCTCSFTSCGLKTCDMLGDLW